MSRPGRPPGRRRSPLGPALNPASGAGRRPLPTAGTSRRGCLPQRVREPPVSAANQCTSRADSAVRRRRPSTCPLREVLAAVDKSTADVVVLRYPRASALVRGADWWFPTALLADSSSTGPAGRQGPSARAAGGVQRRARAGDRRRPGGRPGRGHLRRLWQHYCANPLFDRGLPPAASADGVRHGGWAAGASSSACRRPAAAVNGHGCYKRVTWRTDLSRSADPSPCAGVLRWSDVPQQHRSGTCSRPGCRC